MNDFQDYILRIINFSQFMILLICKKNNRRDRNGLIINIRKIPDHRDAQGREYRLEHISFFSVLAPLSNDKGYTDIERFIRAHFEKLKSIYNFKWRKLPHFSAMRKIIIGINPKELEKAFEAAATQQGNLSQKKGVNIFSVMERHSTVASHK